MKLRILVATLVALTASACSSLSPTLTRAPITVENDELDKYWKSSGFSFNIASLPGPAGSVKLRYLIDSNGDVHDVEVIDFQPNEDWVVAGKRALGNIEYKPSEQNTTKQPVIVETEFTFINR
ncbi:energy transducer TonB [Alteromonas halophila]|uniref:TonB C-terminal domain-containing protein n=1 Tax=Alteromonas halophila TaxID=516698 RepID=A0A918JRH9_9ALTE|nr:energy transducer TonB [Alteromonas halophila]GGW97372.1 hypothetical protein GCM10007391_34330 [Alteromonas halophila]